MAKFVLTIESEDPEEIAGFLSPDRQSSNAKPERDEVTQAEIGMQQAGNPAEPKKRGRPKSLAESQPSSEGPSASENSSAEETKASENSPAESNPQDLFDEVKALILKAVSTKSAKETVSLLAEKCGTPSPQAMNPEQLAAAKSALEALLNG